MTGHPNKTTVQVCSPFKALLEKIGDRYQSYCTTHKTHAMTTHHGGAGCTGEDRVLDSHVEDTRNIDDNDSTNSSESMIVFKGSEEDGTSATSYLTARQT